MLDIKRNPDELAPSIGHTGLPFKKTRDRLMFALLFFSDDKLHRMVPINSEKKTTDTRRLNVVARAKVAKNLPPPSILLSKSIS